MDCLNHEGERPLLMYVLTSRCFAQEYTVFPTQRYAELKYNYIVVYTSGSHTLDKKKVNQSHYRPEVPRGF